MPGTDSFDYDRNMPLRMRQIGERVTDGLVQRLFTYDSPFGYRRIAELVRPEGDVSCAAILYVHWYEPESPHSNRTQFVDEAREMAKRGTVCLLIETMWSDIDWFHKRTQDDDYENSIRQTIELRQAMDILLAQPGVDTKRFAYVGHDFGGMYGVLAGGIDPRPTCYVVMASTPRFADWYLYYPKLEGEAREAFIARMRELDPIEHVARLAPAPIFFQFAHEDFHVPQERASAFFAAAREPKQIGWYDGGHELDEVARRDRMAWLSEQLGLRQI
jgi:dienelactone hydrolase